jgi:amidohydrolase
METISPNLETIKSLRHELHQHPELSGQEMNTAETVLKFLMPTQPDSIAQQVGGHGLILTYNSDQPGPHLMFRAELDALPIQEKNSVTHRSRYPEKGHLCGHDGHMSILAGLGLHYGRFRPKKGKVSLLFQPAEETGEGALEVVKSQAWQKNKPDFMFALHNLPGFPTGQVLIKENTFAAASQGMCSILRGATAHAAHPEQAKSPAIPLSQIIQDFQHFKEDEHQYHDFILLTVVHAVLGTPSYGITPGYGQVRATLRSFTNEDIHYLQSWAERVVLHRAEAASLTHEFQYSEIFPATINHPEAFKILSDSLVTIPANVKTLEVPFRWSEDFGYYSRDAKTCFFGLGSGVNMPNLHHENYDFPDKIAADGMQIFLAITDHLLGT